MRSLLAVIVVIGSGCHSSSSQCVPGMQTSCACPGGGAGVQVCAGDGSAYGACMGCGSTDDMGGASDQGSGATAKKRVFFTSQTYDGNLGGVAGADAKCNTVAQAAIAAGFLKDEGTTWKAWMSDSTANAIDRLADVGPWYLVDDLTKVFNNKANVALVPSQLLNGITMDERGNKRATPYCANMAWTGTLPGGMVAPTHCTNWTSADSNATGTQGELATTDDNWTDYTSSTSCSAIPNTAACSYTHSLICFEQ